MKVVESTFGKVFGLSIQIMDRICFDDSGKFYPGFILTFICVQIVFYKDEEEDYEN